MKKKIFGIFVCLMLVSTTFLVINRDYLEVKAISEEGGEEGFALLNTTYIKKITENLSKIVKDTTIYPPGTIAKGRFFGTNGEQHAATDIISYEMDKIDLYNPGLNPPYLQRLENLDALYYLPKIFPPWINLTTKIDQLAMGLTITNRTNPYNITEKKITDFYISPFWNTSALRLLYDKHKLTYNLSYEDLSITPVPTYNCYFATMNATWFENFLINTTVIDLISNLTDYNFSGLWNLSIPLFEDFYNFTFDNLDPDDNTTWPDGFERFDDCIEGDYVMIEEDSHFNPFTNSQFWSPNHLFDEFKILGFIEDSIYKALPQFAWTIWYLLNPHCKGILRYDTDNFAYDMNDDRIPFPYIYINGTEGKPIYGNYNDYTISFYIDQKYDENVESYNVIGQINGTDPSKTVIVDCLYDCWYNEGTSDSAIGMAIVLAIAKYMKENNIKPKYNIKFLAFAGEEYGMLGAYQYLADAIQNNETIVTVIDLNQIGFDTDLLGYDPNAPYFNIRLELWTNKLFIRPTLTHNGKVTDYTKRTGDIIPLYAKWNWIGGCPGNYEVFSKNGNLFRHPNTISTIYIVKNGPWKYHHRDGMNHTEGDSIKYYDSRDVNVSAELIWNITKLYTVNPNTTLEDESYTLHDSVNDENSYPDSVDVNFKIKTILPQDRVTVKAILYSKKFPMIHKYVVEENYTVTSASGIEDTITIFLPDHAPEGDYVLKLHLYNSTGGTLIHYFDNIDVNFSNLSFYDTLAEIYKMFNFTLPPFARLQYIADIIFNDDCDERVFNQFNYVLDYYFDLALWANDSYKPDPFPMYPLNDVPNPPETPTGPTKTIKAGNKYFFSTSATDVNNDQIYYQWDWRANTNVHGYSRWKGPVESGEEHTQGHIWEIPGNYQVKARAKNHGLNPNLYSEWSEPFSVTVDSSCNFNSQSEILVGQQAQFYGIMYGDVEPYSWQWNFGERGYNYTRNATQTFATGNYLVNLTVTDNESNTYYCEKNIEVKDIVADFTTNDDFFKTNQTAIFTNTSQANHEIINYTWNFGDGNVSYDQNANHTYANDGEYNVTLTVKDSQNNTDIHFKIICVDSIEPQIVSSPYSPELIGTGSKVNISADFYDNASGIKSVKVNITKPDGTYGNHTMYETNESPYDYEFVFNDTDMAGDYFYNIWLEDNSGNTFEILGQCFNVSNLFGYTEQGEYYQDTNNRITGSVFKCYEDCQADNITAYIYSPTSNPAKKSKCLIYRTNDSTFVGETDEMQFGTQYGGSWEVYPFSNPKPILFENTDYILTLWSNGTSLYYDSSGDEQGRYNNSSYTSQGTPESVNFTNETRIYSIYCSYTSDNFGPKIANISCNPNTVGFGSNVTISVDVTDNMSGVDIATVNIMDPETDPGQPPSLTMTKTEGNTFEYIFNDTWKNGQYNYTILAIDENGNSNTSSQFSFNVSAQATISVCTVQDVYGNNIFVNVTDPTSNPPEIGYELLDDGKILRIWNTLDSYYFNTSSGIQLTNHYNDYWSHNVLMLGYYNNEQWNLIYRTDELSGFNKDISTDNETYVNATLWKDLTYNSYNFRLAIRYHLGIDDNELTVIPYIKNLGQAIPYNLGFAWEINNIQIDMTPENDFIEINRTFYDLDENLDLSFKDLAVPMYCWNETINESYICGYETLPYFYIKENLSETTSESLYLRWNESLDYKVKVKSRNGQYNAPVTLAFKIGTLAQGQEKYTEMFWHDASEITYYFNSYCAGETWTNNPSYMVDTSLSTYASTSTNSDVELCNANNCTGTNLGDISKVEIRAYAYRTGSTRDILLRPVFNGVNDGTNYHYSLTTTPSWTTWFDITGDSGNVPPGWNWNKIKNMDCDVEAGTGGFSFTMYCGKVEARVTYIPNSNPVISNPYPADDSSGISIAPTLNITVSDPDGDSMNITWLSNSSGTWVAFGWNNTASNGTYHQTMDNASVNGQWWYWKVNVTDGSTYVESDVYRFYTGNESKIKNIGSTNISGYLFMQVQFFDGQNWILAVTAVDETTPRTIHNGEQFGLDSVFNGRVNTNILDDFGTGLYRVYAALGDPDGNVLVCDDETALETWYEFDVNLP